MNRKVKKAIELIAFFVYNRICGFFMSLDEKKVVFASEARENLKGNLRAVYEKFPDSYDKVIHIKGDRRDSYGLRDTLKLWNDLTTAKYIKLHLFL